MSDMSIAGASALFSGSPAEISDLRAELADHHADEPQKAMLADLALREVEQGMEKLRALGHHLYLAWGEGPRRDEFPKMLYRDRDERQQVVFTEGEEAQARADGYDDHPSLRKPVEVPDLSPAPASPSTSVKGGDLETGKGLPVEGAAGAGAKSDRPEDLRSVTDDAQRKELAKAMEQTGPKDPEV